MALLREIADFCDRRTRRAEIPDHPDACNGLQVGNAGEVTKIGAAADAALSVFDQASRSGIDFLIVHHGLFWQPLRPLTGSVYEKLRLLIQSGCALYASHLPLDCHPQIGNNALIAQQLGLTVAEWFDPFEGIPIGAIAEFNEDRASLRQALEKLFPGTVRAIEFGSKAPPRVGIESGRAGGCIADLIRGRADTLVTGELPHHFFNTAREEKLNLYLCGHYATETFGVKALAAETAGRFGLPWEFIDTQCPL